MKIGDLVMWIGTDSDHGEIGVIIDIDNRSPFQRREYAVLWADGVVGKVFNNELMAVDDVPDR